MEADPKKLELIRSLLDSAEGNVRSAKQMLAEITGGKTESLRQKATGLNRSDDGKVVEGIFDGQNMVDGGGKSYPVPANYASKSKLVEGDTLKLTIMADGSFIYKQIAPIQRKKIIGTLTMDGDQYRVLADGKSYKILYASVTFFKGNVGDQVTLIVPQGAEANWGAVENIIPGVKQSGGDAAEAAPAEEPTIQVVEPEPVVSEESTKIEDDTSDEIKPSPDVQNLADEVESAVAAASGKKPKKSKKKKESEPEPEIEVVPATEAPAGEASAVQAEAPAEPATEEAPAEAAPAAADESQTAVKELDI
jgi:hypothetical protein